MIKHAHTDITSTTNAHLSILDFGTRKSKRVKGVRRGFDLKWRFDTFFVETFLTLETCIIAYAEIHFFACTAPEFIKTKFFIVAPKKRDYRELTDITLVAVKQRFTLLITATCAGKMWGRIKWLKLLLILLL